MRVQRITPACAGKRWYRGNGRRYSEDHPRVCGEKPSCFVCRICYQGSPPRVRGKAALHLGISPQGGITPACAGKSSRYLFQRCLIGDHPRVCGEKV